VGVATTKGIEKMSKGNIPDLSKAKERSATTEAAEQTLREQQQTKKVLVPLDKIKERPSGDSRKLKDGHIAALTESIAVLGLIMPLTIDRNYNLLAGGHRKAALHKLAQDEPEQFAELFAEGVPVNIIDIDAEKNTVKALQIEVEENTQRKNYNHDEIREAARKLKEAGYEKLRGRPGEGQKSINRELESVFGLSRRQITRIMDESEQKEKSETRVSLFSKIQQYKKQTEAFNDYLGKNQLKEKITAELKEITVNLKQVLQETETLLETINRITVEGSEEAPRAPEIQSEDS
jgi:ParB-like chromosome segregation protein Spo0J